MKQLSSESSAKFNLRWVEGGNLNSFLDSFEPLLSISGIRLPACLCPLIVSVPVCVFSFHVAFLYISGGTAHCFKLLNYASVKDKFTPSSFKLQPT